MALNLDGRDRRGAERDQVGVVGVVERKDRLFELNQFPTELLRHIARRILSKGQQATESRRGSFGRA